eukprot:4506842-Prymnesium_polylepis.1
MSLCAAWRSVPIRSRLYRRSNDKHPAHHGMAPAGSARIVEALGINSGLEPRVARVPAEVASRLPEGCQ